VATQSPVPVIRDVSCASPGRGGIPRTRDQGETCPDAFDRELWEERPPPPSVPPPPPGGGAGGGKGAALATHGSRRGLISAAPDGASESLSQCDAPDRNTALRAEASFLLEGRATTRAELGLRPIGHARRHWERRLSHLLLARRRPKLITNDIKKRLGGPPCAAMKAQIQRVVPVRHQKERSQVLKRMHTSRDAPFIFEPGVYPDSVYRTINDNLEVVTRPVFGRSAPIERHRCVLPVHGGIRKGVAHQLRHAAELSTLH